MDVEISPLSRADFGELLTLNEWAWGYDADSYGREDNRAVAGALEWDRTYAARFPPSATLAGSYSVVSGNVPLPHGRSVRASGLTWVGVHPGERRRGVLTAMIQHHLDDVAARGEPLSLLFASEATIYGRFGYGTASYGLRLTLGRDAALRDVPGADDLVAGFDHADPARHVTGLADCYERARAGRPGWISRDRPAAWKDVFLDPRARRNGAERLKLLTVSTREGRVRGYALFRRRERWEQHRPDGTVEIAEAVALDAAAVRALWGRLVALDLVSRVQTRSIAVDDALLHLLVDPRAALPRLADGLWARLVDVPAALAARGYAGPVDVVLDVTDGLLPGNAGRWHLVGEAGSATCTRTGRPAQLGLDVRELAAAYLGGTSLAALAAAGLVRVHDEPALTAAATAFGSPLAPHCPWQF